MADIIAVLCAITLLITSTSTATVKWIPNASFKLPSNFKDGKLPCSKQTVVFPETIIGSILISPDTEVSGFILPENGDLILDGSIYFGPNVKDTKCKDENSYYIDKAISGWYQADVWSSDKFNEATPDSERIPCFNDVVEFPDDARYSVLLPSDSQFIKSIISGNKTWEHTDDFYYNIIGQDYKRQQFILNDQMRTGLQIGRNMPCPKFGCPCQIHSLNIDCSVKFCPRRDCEHPVKPLGFCCEICGGYTVFDMDEAFDPIHFSELVENVINGFGKDKVEYHIGFIANETPIRRNQLVIVDKGVYTGTSAQIISEINYKLNHRWFKGELLTQISGSPLNTVGGGTIFVSMFFLAVVTLGAFYVYYYKIPDIRIPSLGGGIAGAFRRYERRSDSVVSLTRRDSAISTRSGFRNPLYDSKRGRVQVTESLTDD